MFPWKRVFMSFKVVNIVICSIFFQALVFRNTSLGFTVLWKPFTAHGWLFYKKITECNHRSLSLDFPSLKLSADLWPLTLHQFPIGWFVFIWPLWAAPQTTRRPGEVWGSSERRHKYAKPSWRLWHFHSSLFLHFLRLTGSRWLLKCHFQIHSGLKRTEIRFFFVRGLY